MTSRTRTANGGHGSKWIRAEKRLRVYQRDGWRCGYCERRVYSVALVRDQRARPPRGAEPATLDHVRCRSRGGRPDHGAGNLVTCCLSCNSRRQDRPVAVYARELAGGDGSVAREIVARVRRLRRRELPRLEAE